MAESWSLLYSAPPSASPSHRTPQVLVSSGSGAGEDNGGWPGKVTVAVRGLTRRSVPTLQRALPGFASLL